MFFLHQFGFLVLSHHYGVNGGELKRLDTKSLIIDLELLQTIADTTFIDHIQKSLDSFLQALKNEEKLKGNNTFRSYLKKLVSFKHMLFCVEMSSTSKTEVKSTVIFVINTADPSVDIVVTLEVNYKVEEK